jgi:hypothetical protein
MLDTVVRPMETVPANAVGPPIELPGPQRVLLVPVIRGGADPRPIGAYVLADGKVRYRPALDVHEVLAATLAAVTIAAIALARRRRPAIGAIHMGPGGWVSLKGIPAPALTSTHRPWWARALRARRLVVEPSARRQQCARRS